MLSGYVRGSESGTEGKLTKTPGGVYFDDGFIRRLKEGEVYFAGIDFGPLRAIG